MPYDAISDLPDQTSDLTNEQKRRFLAAFNTAYEAGKGKESAFRIAWAAAKNAKGGEVSKDRVTIQVDSYTRQDGTKVKEHERQVQSGSKAHEQAVEEGRVVDGAGDERSNLANALIVGGSVATVVGTLTPFAVSRFGQLFSVRPRPVRTGVGGQTQTPSRMRQNWRSMENKYFNRIRQQVGDNSVEWLDSLDATPRTPGADGVFRRHAYDTLEGRNLEETLFNVEDVIRNSEVEMSFVIDNKGFIMGGYRGDRHSVASPIPSDWSPRDTITLTLTHNHPLATPLSSGDLRLMAESKFGRVRAVQADRSVSELTISQPFYGLEEDALRHIANEVDSAGHSYFQPINQAEVNRRIELMQKAEREGRIPDDLLSDPNDIADAVHRKFVADTTARTGYGRDVENIYKDYASRVPWMDYTSQGQVVKRSESATLVGGASIMPNMDWSSPLATESLREMARLGNLPGWYAKRLREFGKSRVWVDEHIRGGQKVEGHWRSLVGSVIGETAPVADLGEDKHQKFGQSVARAGAYSGIGAGALALGRHYLSKRPTMAAAYGLYGLANIFGAGHQGHQAYQIRQRMNKSMSPTAQQDFERLLATIGQQTGAAPEDIIEGFGEWLQKKKEPPTEVTQEHLAQYLTETYSQEREQTSKHLIGRHDQQDHNPHKDRITEVDGRTGFRIQPGDDRLRTPHTRSEHKGLLRRGPTMMDRFHEHRAEVKAQETREAGASLGLDPDSPDFNRKVGALGRSLGVVSDDDLSQHGEVLFHEDVMRIADAVKDQGRPSQ